MIISEITRPLKSDVLALFIATSYLFNFTLSMDIIKKLLVDKGNPHACLYDEDRKMYFDVLRATKVRGERALIEYRLKKSCEEGLLKPLKKTYYEVSPTFLEILRAKTPIRKKTSTIKSHSRSLKTPIHETEEVVTEDKTKDFENVCMVSESEKSHTENNSNDRHFVDKTVEIMASEGESPQLNNSNTEEIQETIVPKKLEREEDEAPVEVPEVSEEETPVQNTNAAVGKPNPFHGNKVIEGLCGMLERLTEKDRGRKRLLEAAKDSSKSCQRAPEVSQEIAQKEIKPVRTIDISQQVMANTTEEGQEAGTAEISRTQEAADPIEAANRKSVEPQEPPSKKKKTTGIPRNSILSIIKDPSATEEEKKQRHPLISGKSSNLAQNILGLDEDDYMGTFRDFFNSRYYITLANHNLSKSHSSQRLYL